MNRTARSAALALAATACAGALAACGSGAAASPDEAGLRAHMETGIRAWKAQDAPGLVAMTKNDECPLSVSDAVMGMAMAKGFGLDKMDVAIKSVKITDGKGTVVTQAFGETEETSYTWRNGGWGEDNKNDDGTCE